MQEVANVPFYLDWSFWAIIVAAVALILSQIPPIHLLLKKARLDIEVYSRMHITHRVGNPNLQIHLIISNIGGRTIKIEGIKAIIKRDGKHIANLPAQTYVQNPNDVNSLLFTSLTLKPKEKRAHLVMFVNYFSRSVQKKYKKAEFEIKTNIFDKRKQLQIKAEEDVEADNQYVEPFMQFFNELFVWFPGEYEICVRIGSDPEKTSIEKKYRFTLFESESDELSNYKDDYKFGIGIFFDRPQNRGIIVELIEV